MYREVSEIPNTIAKNTFLVLERIIKSNGVSGNFKGPFTFGINDNKDFVMNLSYIKEVKKFSTPLSFERVEYLLYSDVREIVYECGLDVEKSFSDGKIRDNLWECISYIRKNSPQGRVHGYVVFGEVSSTVKPTSIILRSGYFLNAENVSNNGNSLWLYLREIGDKKIEKISYYPDTGELLVHGRGRCASVEFYRKGIYAYKKLKKLFLNDFCCLGYRMVVFNRKNNKFSTLDIPRKRGKSEV